MFVSLFAAVHRSEAETLDMEKPVLALIGKGQSKAACPLDIGNTGERLHVKGGCSEIFGMTHMI
mgnify:CR=1 FL=1